MEHQCFCNFRPVTNDCSQIICRLFGNISVYELADCGEKAAEHKLTLSYCLFSSTDRQKPPNI